mgnify:CR=1 FL=1
MILLFGTVFCEDFELAAVALTSTHAADECIKTNGDIEYWVNTATNAAQTTKIIATGKMTMASLDVTGAVDFNTVSVNTLIVRGTTPSTTLKGEVTFDVDDGTQYTLKQLFGKVTTLEGKVTTLEGKVTTLEGKVTTLEGKVTALETP